MKRTLPRWNQSVFLACLIGFFMLWELEKMINFPGSDLINTWLLVAELIVLGAVLTKIDFGNSRWMIILILGLVLIFLTSAFRSREILERTQNALMRGVLVYILCPSIGILLCERDLKKFLRVFIFLWVLFHTGLSVIGIYCMYSGTQIIDYSLQYEINNNNGVLKLMAYHTVTAANLTIAIMMAVVGIALVKNKVVRILFCFCICPMLYALALSTGRAGMIATGIGLGLSVAALISVPLQKKMRSRWLRYLILLCIIVLITIGLYEALELLQSLFNKQLENRNTALLFSSAKAENMAINFHDVGVVKPRSIETFGLSNREAAYRISLQLLKNQPDLLLKGTSVPLIMEFVNATEYLGYDHVHCMPLQILLETGVWGLILFAFFIVSFIRSCWRLFFSLGEPYWKRLVFLPAACMMCIETIECITRLDKGLQAAVPMMFFYGVTMCLDRQNRKKPDNINVQPS